jgi:Tfp pilus assembly protein PilX
MVGMIMLLMMTLIVVGVIRLTTRHTQVVSNEQFQTEATSAANYALDMVLTTPASTWDVNYKGGTGKTMYVNLGTTSSVDAQDSSAVAVTVKNLTCKRQRTIKNSELIKTNGTLTYVPEADTSCFGGGGSPITIVDTSAVAPGDDSFCTNVLYEMEATVSGASVVNASTTVLQGVEVRRGIDETVNCN